MPTATTIWLKVGKADARMYKTLTSNASLVRRPEITSQVVVDGQPVTVSTKRVLTAGHWEEIGTGEKLIVETILKNSKGEVVPTSKAIDVIDKLENQVLLPSGKPADKKSTEDFILNSDGSIGDRVMPYPPTERFEVMESPDEAKETGQGYWVPANFMEKFLIHEEYTLSTADPRRDVEMYEEIDKAMKRDEVILSTYSSGSYKLYYCFLVPYISEGRFCWILKLSEKQIIYNALHDIPGPKEAIKPKLVQTLPPLAGLLTVPTRK